MGVGVGAPVDVGAGVTCKRGGGHGSISNDHTKNCIGVQLRTEHSKKRIVGLHNV